MANSERRASGIKRVAVETTVEICGRDAQVPAFEAESIEVSGRGMHVRTAFVPELNAPLVLRFEDRGREVLVEGEVAWRREDEAQGEFGIKFTALDSKSVEVLRDLCGTQLKASEPVKKGEAVAAGHDVPLGAPVKLHIEGLNSPMKARVRDVTTRRMQVGSNLEFLKVGRAIEIEDVDNGGRKDAHIDSVTVSIDPQTQVPQLVVALRYPGDATPQPSVVDAGLSEADLDSEYSERLSDEHDVHAERGPAAESVRAGAPVDDDVEDDGEYDADADADSDRDGDEAANEYYEDDEAEHVSLKEKLEGWAGKAGAIASRSSDVLGVFSKRAARGMGRFVKGAGHQLGELRAHHGAPDKSARRKTAPRPLGGYSPEAKRVKLQPQHRGQGARASVAPGPISKSSPRRLAALGAAGTLLSLGLVFALTGRDDASANKNAPVLSGAVPNAGVAPTGVAPTLPNAAPVTGTAALRPAVGAAQPGAAPASDPALGSGEADEQQGIVADVPLFGPTTLATATPQALGAAPAADEVAYEDQASDESFTEPTAPLAKNANEASLNSAEANPEAVPPWGKGRLHLPTIHRLRLDAPGAKLKGYEKADGFSVLIPGRKVMESPKLISKRDDRLRSVTADSSPEGVVVTFKFRSQVPAYKVRLRKDYVEFFVSAVTK